MMFSREFGVHGGLGPLWRLQSWALERAAAIHCQSTDLRWVVVALGLDALAALDALIQKQLVPLHSDYDSLAEGVLAGLDKG